MNTTPGYDDTNVNVIKKIYDEIKTPLINIFNLSIKTGIFPDKPNIGAVSPVFTNGSKTFLINY